MRSIPRMLGAIAALALIAPLTACGSEGDGGGQTTLTYFTWNNQTNMQPVVDAFEAANPDIKIDLSSANNNSTEYANTLLARASGDQLPDVFHLSLETRSELISSGLVMDITEESFHEGADPTAKEMYTVDDRIYAMSLSAWAGVIIYNEDLVAEAGYDSVPEDLDGFIELGHALAELGVTPYMEDTAGGSGSLPPMLGGYYAEQGRSDVEIFEGGESFDTWIPVMEQWLRIIEEGVMPREVVGVSGDQVKQNFLNGDVAMYRSGPWDFNDIEDAGINFSTAAFPAVEGGQPYVGGGPDSPYALSASLDGEKKDAAIRFMEFLNSEEGLGLLEENLNQVSTSQNYDANVAPQIQDVYSNYIQQGKYYWTTYPEKGAVMSNEFVAQIQLLIQGQTTPEQVAAALDAKWN